MHKTKKEKAIKNNTKANHQIVRKQNKGGEKNLQKQLTKCQ